MSAATPGQAAYEALGRAAQRRLQVFEGTPWHALDDDTWADWENIAACAIAAQEPHAAPELQAVESVYLYHWRFDRGEEYGLFRDKADAEAAAEARRAESPGEGLFEVLGMAILGRPEPKPAPELAAHEADIASLTDQRNRVSETADQLREQIGVLQDQIGNLAAGLKLSADASRPSKKSDIEDGCAAALLGILDPR